MNKLFKFLTLAAALSIGTVSTAQPIINGNYLRIYRSPWYMVKDLFITQPQTEAAKLHTTRRGIIKSAFYGLGTAAALYSIHTWIFAPFMNSRIAAEEAARREAQAAAQQEQAQVPEQTVEESGNRSGERVTKDWHQVEAMVHQERRRPTKLERFANLEMDGKLVVYGAAGSLVFTAGVAYKLFERSRSGRRNTHLEQLKMIETVLDRWNEVRSYFPETLQPIFDTLKDLRKVESTDYAANVENALEIIKSEVALHAK